MAEKHKYLVAHEGANFEPGEFFIVEAENADAAGMILFLKELENENFLEYIYGRSVNASWCERFWIPRGKEQDHFNETGEVLATEEQFVERVRAYWGKRQDWADLYLQHYFSGFPAEGEEVDDDYYDTDEYEDIFPLEMKREILFRDEWTKVEVIKLDDVPTLE